MDDKPMIEQKLPLEMGRIARRIEEYMIATLGQSPQINHVLVNEYQPGEGIMPHSDGPLYAPCVATITTGSGQVLRLVEQLPDRRKEHARVYLAPRALNILFGQSYSQLLHEIEPLDQDHIDTTLANIGLLSPQLGNTTIEREKRVSFTFRQVKNSVKRPKFLKFWFVTFPKTWSL